MNKKNYISNITFLLIMMFSSLIISTSILFIFGIQIGLINIIIPVIVIIVVSFIILHDIKTTCIVISVTFAIIAICILLSGSVFDNTWDGAAYHKQAIGLLKEGWNPVYQSASQYNELSGSIDWIRENPLLWAEVYPKATWYFAGTIYYFTGNIENGKAYTLLFMIILFGIVNEYCKYKTTNTKACICGIIAAINPIALAQMFTYYLDGMAASVLIGIIILTASILDKIIRGIKKHAILS